VTFFFVTVLTCENVQFSDMIHYSVHKHDSLLSAYRSSDLRVSCAVCRITLQCVAVCYSVLRCVAVCDMIHHPPHIRGLILVYLVHYVAVCCSVLQCVT